MSAKRKKRRKRRPKTKRQAAKQKPTIARQKRPTKLPIDHVRYQNPVPVLGPNRGVKCPTIRVRIALVRAHAANQGQEAVRRVAVVAEAAVAVERQPAEAAVDHVTVAAVVAVAVERQPVEAAVDHVTAAAVAAVVAELRPAEAAVDLVTVAAVAAVEVVLQPVAVVVAPDIRNVRAAVPGNLLRQAVDRARTHHPIPVHRAVKAVTPAIRKRSVLAIRSDLTTSYEF